MHQVLINIRNIRLSRGYSQEYVAARIDISQSSYTRFESGRSKTLYEIIEQVAKFFGLSVPELINYHQNPGFGGSNSYDSFSEDSLPYKRLTDEMALMTQRIQRLEANYSALSAQMVDLQKAVQRTQRKKK